MELLLAELIPMICLNHITEGGRGFERVRLKHQIRFLRKVVPWNAIAAQPMAPIVILRESRTQ